MCVIWTEITGINSRMSYIYIRIGSGREQIGQIWDLLRPLFDTFFLAEYNRRNLTLKSPLLFQFIAIIAWL